MSLASLYKLKQGKNAKNEKQKEQTENAETLKAKLEKIAIPPDIAKRWVSDPCLPPGTIVYMEDGFKPIKDVDVGESVLTSTGYGHVTEIHERRYDGELISLTPYYANVPLHLTPNHPVLAIKTVKSCPCNRPPHFRTCLPTCSSSKNNSWCPAYFKNYEPKWIPASQLEKGDAVALGYPAMTDSHVAIQLERYATRGYRKQGDFLVASRFRKMSEEKLKQFISMRLAGASMTEIKRALGFSSDETYSRWLTRLGFRNCRYLKEYRKIPAEVLIDEKLARLFGYYVAEGCAHGGSLRFSFNADEHEFIADVQQIFKEVFTLSGHERGRNGEKCIEISFGCFPIANMFKSLFGNNATEKKLPNWFLSLPPNVLYQFLIGYLRGDGYISTTGRHGLTATTASHVLARQLCLILAKLGIPAGIYRTTWDESDINGRPVKTNNTRYNVGIPSKFSRTILKDVGGQPRSPCYRRPYGFKHDNLLFVCLKEVRRTHYDGLVYNLEVNPAQSYVAEGIIVHNCGKPC